MNTNASDVLRHMKPNILYPPTNCVCTVENMQINAVVAIGNGAFYPTPFILFNNI